MTKRDYIQQDALREIQNHTACSINISMGVGKTRIAIMDMVDNNYNHILIVISKHNIKESWINEILIMKAEYLIPRIKFSTYASLNKQNLSYYDKIYLDECHNLTVNNSKKLKKYRDKGGRVLGITGTYPEYGIKKELCNYICPEEYTYTVEQAIKDKILNNYLIFIHKIELSSINDFVIKYGNRKFVTSELKSYRYWTSQVERVSNRTRASIGRLSAMKSYNSKLEYIKKLINNDKNKNNTTKKLIFVNTIDQANQLPNPIHSKIDKDINKRTLDKIANGDINTITAVEQLSEGVTIPGLKIAIISHSYSNNRKLAQKIGRVLRLNPNDVCKVHILCYKNTVDEDWIESALEDFDWDRVKIINK